MSLWPDRLALSCLSRARMEAGKALLQDLLGTLIHHHHDRIEPVDDYMARQPAQREPAPIPPEIAAASRG